VRAIAAATAGAVLLVGGAGFAAAGEPVVAVMPFRDLSATRAPVGEAIRETLTVDLRETGVRVVERGAIDKVIAEQNLEDKKRDLPAIGAVRVGTLVGATWIVTGAYQRAGGEVRLTARIVDVSSGELRGSAKADGGADELLGLQDRLAAALFASAGLPAGKVQKMTRRARPKVPYRALELYGDAVQMGDAEGNAKKKRELLQQAVAAAPQLTYAVKDLEALQQRMGGYSAVANARLDEKERALIGKAEDGRRAPAERVAAAKEAIDSLAAARRYHALAEVAERWRGVTLPGMAEMAGAALFRGLEGLHRWDAALGAGEQYLKAFPTGARYREIEGRMHEIVETRRKREARRAEYAADLAEKRQGMGAMPPNGAERRAAWDYAPCICARWNSQLNELMLDACGAFAAAYRKDARADVQENVVAARFFVVLALAERGEFEKARPLAEALLVESDAWDEELRKMMGEWPTD
jgi:TolB-like protein